MEDMLPAASCLWVVNWMNHGMVMGLGFGLANYNLYGFGVMILSVFACHECVCVCMDSHVR